MRERLLVAVLLTTAAVVLLSAQKAPDLAAQIAVIEGPQSPSRQGFDPYTIPEMMKRFHVPGVSIAVVRDFQVQWTKTYGVADVVTNAPVTLETRFQAASISKPVTAFAVLRAVEAGKLSLPISKTYKLADIAEALAVMRTNQHFGKIVIAVS